MAARYQQASLAEAAKPHLAELTSTRFIAAMTVFLAHLASFGLPPWLFPPWLMQSFSGAFGVSFFFVLSGFILCYVYRQAFADGVARDTYRRFLVARVARVYPCYVLALVLLTGMYLLIPIGLPPNPVTSWLANLFALQTFAPSYETQQSWNAPSWSISTELFFYLLCPAILAAVSRHARGRVALAGLVLLTLAYAMLAHTIILVVVFKLGLQTTFWLDLVSYRNIVWRLPEFVLGVLAATLLYEGHLPWLARAAVRNGVLVASLVVVLVLNLAPWPPGGTPASLITREYRVYVAYMVPFTAIITVLAAGPTIASPFLSTRWMVFLGEISYGVYIYHWIAWTALSAAFGTTTYIGAWAVVAVGGVVLFSAASYLWFEKPLRRWIRGA